jgi:hypothetical protein
VALLVLCLSREPPNRRAEARLESILSRSIPSGRRDRLGERMARDLREAIGMVVGWWSDGGRMVAVGVAKNRCRLLRCEQSWRHESAANGFYIVVRSAYLLSPHLDGHGAQPSDSV